MKHIVVILCLIVLIASDGFSQVELTEAQQKEYQKQKLSVEVRRKGAGSYGSGMISYSSWLWWDAYQGFNKITEAEFFRIIGYEDEARQAARHRRTGQILCWGGVGGAVIGATIMLVGGYDNVTKTTIGAVIGLGSCIPMIMSIGINSRNCYPYSTVEGLTEDYNRSLLQDLKNK
jgi:hypothetical protein